MEREIASEICIKLIALEPLTETALGMSHITDSECCLNTNVEYCLTAVQEIYRVNEQLDASVSRAY